MTEPLKTHPFRVYLVQAGVFDSEPRGGAFDEFSAVLIGCAVFQSALGYSPTSEATVVVHDSNNLEVAYIGRPTVSAGQT